MGHSSPVNTILLNSDEAELYSGLKGGMIVLWDIYNQKVKINLQGHSTLITSMSIYRNNNIPCVLASASADGKIKLWDLRLNNSDNKNIKNLITNDKSYNSSINYIDRYKFDLSNNIIITGSYDEKIIFFVKKN